MAVNGYLLDGLGKTAVVWIALVVGLLGIVGGIGAAAFLWTALRRRLSVPNSSPTVYN